MQVEQRVWMGKIIETEIFTLCKSRACDVITSGDRTRKIFEKSSNLNRDLSKSINHNKT